jgi:hypothetical protein
LFSHAVVKIGILWYNIDRKAGGYTMLKIYFGEMKNTVYDTSLYFDNVYEDSWLTSDISKKMIKDIDKSDVLGSNCIQSPVLGQIAPSILSGGVKTLILMEYDDSFVYNASMCGDNCAKWILDIAKHKDLTINLFHTMDFGDGPFEIEILNTGRVVHSRSEYLDEAFKYV